MTGGAGTFLRSGKVRDLYAIGDDRLLLVASDRLSAFDVVLPTPVPDKGRVLTGLSRFWFARTRDIIPNHLVGTNPADVPDGVAPPDVAAELRGRMMICRRAEVLPVEVVVRGYLAGSGWKEYQASGEVCGVALPPGLRESDRLPEPILTPATKARAGEHDENIDFPAMVAALERTAIRSGSVGSPRDLAGRVRELAIALYRRAAAQCESVGLILADTKFELGLVDGDLTLVDEALTPDSSRFWDAATYAPGGPQASFDKQFVRDWLEGQPWDKTAPGPALPPDVVAGTRARYVEAFERITGASFDRYLEEDVIA
ncbi:MAG TPA: phosphoribosylaminoimidazolesuccinocarboxamide synthase [Candidatus Limnocylindrales bacterium]|nr:phosphoribosylaminoimidazolesuccinocarboxamide synthase [Candidatus Limnocylindrales bacterium]